MEFEDIKEFEKATKRGRRELLRLGTGLIFVVAVMLFSSLNEGASGPHGVMMIVAAMMALTAGWIEQLYVEPAAQGQGLGAALLATAKRAAHGAAGLDLWAFQANAQARRFYERHGFVAVAFTDGDNEERVPDMRYAWRP